MIRGDRKKILRQLGFIFEILFIGSVLERIMGIPIPGTVLGMILLLLLLLTGIIKLEMIEEVSQFLLEHLVFLFVPAGVGIVSQLNIIKAEWLPILIIMIISTALAILSTAMTIQGLRRNKRDVK